MAIRFLPDSAKQLEYNVMKAELNTWARFKGITKESDLPAIQGFLLGVKECLDHGDVHTSTLAYSFFLFKPSALMLGTVSHYSLLYPRYLPCFYNPSPRTQVVTTQEFSLKLCSH